MGATMTPKSVCSLLLLCAAALCAEVPAAPLLNPAGGDRAAAPLTPAMEKLKQAHDALVRKDFKAANAAFEAASKLDPKLPGAWLGLAETARVEGKAAKAEEYVRKALEVAPSNPEVQRAYGRLLFAKGDLPGAEAAFKRAIELAPNEAISYLDLGELYSQGSRNFPAAEQAFARAVALDASHAGARFGFATAQAANGKWQEAIASYEEAHRLAPKNPLPLIGLGALYLSRKDSGQARAAFERALKIQPKLPPALEGLGDAFLQERNYVKAEAAYAECANLTPKAANIQFKLGGAQMAQGKRAEAMRSFKAAVAADPRLAVAYNNLAWLEVEQKGDLNQALVWAKRATELDPRVTNYWHTLGVVYLARGENAEAVKALAEATKATPPSAEHLYRLGVAQARSGQKAEAVLNLRRALEINPNFPSAQAARQLLAELGG
jgi:tetratricopeptide (TPR) repeat protein